MHAAIYRYQIDHRGDDVVRLGDNELIPKISQMPGFVAHYVINTGNNEATLVAVFQDEAQVQQFHKVALDWIQQRVATQFGSPYDQQPLQVSFGHVKARNTPTEKYIDVAP